MTCEVYRTILFLHTSQVSSGPEADLKRPAAAGGQQGSDDDDKGAMLNQPEIRAKKRVLDLELAKARQGIGDLPQRVVTMYDKANSMGSGRQKALRKIT